MNLRIKSYKPKSKLELGRLYLLQYRGFKDDILERSVHEISPNGKYIKLSSNSLGVLHWELMRNYTILDTLDETKIST
jgi:hypothetical protein